MASLAAVGVLFSVAACESDPRQETLQVVEGFAGLVAGDEPRAVVVGRDILGNGGTAADAAAAMYFVMSVTMPSRVGLLNSGACVAFYSGGGLEEEPVQANAYVFPVVRTPSGGLASSAVRAMAAMQARHGSLNWAELVTPAESLARFGHAVSRVLARDLGARREAILSDPGLRAIFAPDGRLVGEGDEVTQLELSTALGGIRAQGASYVMAGPFPKRLAEGSTQAGLPLAADELREVKPRESQPQRLEIGDDIAYIAAPPADGGLLAGLIWQMAAEAESYRSITRAEGAHLFTEAAMRAYSARSRWLGGGEADIAGVLDESTAERLMSDYDPGAATPAAELSPAPRQISSDPHTAGFVTADKWGDAVACSFSMNGPFGSARMARGTGVLLPAPEDPGMPPTAIVVANENRGNARFAAAASGGLAAPTTLASVMLETLEDDRSLEDAVAGPRLTHVGAPDVAWLEASMPAEVASGLEQRGHAVRQIDNIGGIVAFHCPGGSVDEPESCEVVHDQRGLGLSFVVQ